VNEGCSKIYSNAVVLLLSDRNSDWLTKVCPLIHMLKYALLKPLIYIGTSIRYIGGYYIVLNVPSERFTEYLAIHVQKHR